MQVRNQVCGCASKERKRIRTELALRSACFLASKPGRSARFALAAAIGRKTARCRFSPRRERPRVCGSVGPAEEPPSRTLLRRARIGNLSQRLIFADDEKEL